MFGIGAVLVGLGLGGVFSHLYFTKKYHLVSKEDADRILKALEKQLSK
jgi:uncharacterized protein YlaN (UPF0358 family)